jgi:hypothetical protein
MSLITVSQLKEICPVHNNVANEKLEAPILLFQETAIRDVLGTKLYDHLIANTSSTTPPYSTLISNYIKAALAWGAFSISFYELHYQFSQNGINVHRTENTEPVDAGTLKVIAEDYKGKAQFYLDRLIAHLKAKYTLYPKYTEATTDCEDRIPDIEVGVTGGLFLD